MKRLITLMLSTVLLCPMYAGAQSTPSVIGTLNWTIDSLPITAMNAGICLPVGFTPEQCNSPWFCTPPAVIYGPCSPATVFSTNIIGLTISVTSLRNGAGHYFLTGSSSIKPYLSDLPPIPLSGSMIESSSTHTMLFTTGTNTVTCVISTATLGGSCSTTTNGTLYTKSISLVSN
jgi:hypothetical protein